MTNEKITGVIKKNPKLTWKSIETKERLDDYIKYISVRIAVYFHTTLGFPIDIFKDKYDSLTRIEQIRFCLDQVNKKHYI